MSSALGILSREAATALTPGVRAAATSSQLLLQAGAAACTVSWGVLVQAKREREGSGGQGRRESTALRQLARKAGGRKSESCNTRGANFSAPLIIMASRGILPISRCLCLHFSSFATPRPPSSPLLSPCAPALSPADAYGTARMHTAAPALGHPLRVVAARLARPP